MTHADTTAAFLRQIIADPADAADAALSASLLQEARETLLTEQKEKVYS